MKKQFAEILDACNDYCLPRQKPELVQKYARYFREGYDAFGLQDTEVRDLCSIIEQKYPLRAEEIIELGHILFATGKYELGSVAILLLEKRYQSFDKLIFEGVQSWFDEGVKNWAHSDVLCSRITPLFYELKLINIGDLQKWQISESRWTRRAVPVSMLCMRKKESSQDLLAFLEPMMLDTERVVHQGLGWFLRELWKIDPELVERFLHKYKQSAARLIFQYATEKMSKEYRLQFRKEKVL